MKRLMILILMLAIISLSASMVSAGENITTDVSSTSSEIPLEDVTTVSNNTFDDIQSAVNEANENSTVILNGTYTGKGRQIQINKDLTIEGAGATLDADFSSRILSIGHSCVTLKNLNFINGKSHTNGGAITSTGNLTIINCSFKDNCVIYEPENWQTDDFDTVGRGGAINANGDLTIINTTFTNNIAELWSEISEAGTYYSENEGQGGAFQSKGKLYMERCEFSYNSGPSVLSHDAQIIGCVFKNQSNSILIDGKSDVTIKDTVFKNCGSYSNQSEIACEYIAQINLHIINCNFTNNKNGLLRIYPDGKVFIENSIFANNTFDYSIYGTTLIEIDNWIRISNTTFTNNTARDTAILDIKNYEIKNCTFKDNRDAAIKSNGVMLDDFMNRTYIFEASITNKVSKTYYNSGKVISIKMVNKNSKKIYQYWDFSIYRNGRPFYDYWFYDTCKIPVSTWKVGTYKVVIRTDSFTKPDELTFKITIQKAKTSVKAPGVTAKYKKSKYFQITVKSNKKAVKNIKLKVKVYTTGKYKIYTLKTNSKGIAKLNTRILKTGIHRVIITSGNPNYQIYAKSTIKIYRR